MCSFSAMTLHVVRVERAGALSLPKFVLPKFVKSSKQPLCTNLEAGHEQDPCRIPICAPDRAPAAMREDHIGGTRGDPCCQSLAAAQARRAGPAGSALCSAQRPQCTRYPDLAMSAPGIGRLSRGQGGDG